MRLPRHRRSRRGQPLSLFWRSIPRATASDNCQMTSLIESQTKRASEVITGPLLFQLCQLLTFYLNPDDSWETFQPIPVRRSAESGRIYGKNPPEPSPDRCELHTPVVHPHCREVARCRNTGHPGPGDRPYRFPRSSSSAGSSPRRVAGSYSR